MIIGITTTLNEADGFQRVNVEYINRVAATGAVPILLTPIAGGAEANREHARHVIELVDGLLITGGGDVHPRYYVPDPAKNRDALGLDDLAAMGCGFSSHCRFSRFSSLTASSCICTDLPKLSPPQYGQRGSSSSYDAPQLLHTIIVSPSGASAEIRSLRHPVLFFVYYISFFLYRKHFPMNRQIGAIS